MDKEKYYYVPVHYVNNDTLEVESISIAKFRSSEPPCTPAFDTRKECMQWFKDRGLGDKKFL